MGHDRAAGYQLPQDLCLSIVEPRGCRAPNDAATIEPGLAPAEVVHKDENDVGFLLSYSSPTQTRQ